MQLVDPELLTNFSGSPAAAFEQVFQKMGLFQNEALRPFLIYVDKVLDHYISRETKDLNCIHLHFPNVANEVRDALLEFLVVKMFHRSLEQDTLLEDYIEQRVGGLNNQLMRNVAPSEAKGAKGGNLAYRNWQAAREEVKKEITFLRSLHPGKSLKPDTILNILNNDTSIMEGSYYAMSTEDLLAEGRRAYNLLNADLDLKDIVKKLYERDFLSNIRQVVVYDNDTRRNAYTFNMKVLSSLRERGYPIQRLIVMSFDRRPFRMRTLINRLNTIYGRYFIPTQQPLIFKHSYVFEPEEVDQILHIRHRHEPIQRIGDRSELYLDYLHLTKEFGLDQLRTLPMVNIYAMAMSKGLADLIMMDLFKDSKSPTLFNEEVRAEIKRLDPDELDQVQRTLGRVLELVTREWTQFKQGFKPFHGKGAIGFVVPLGIMESARFRRELKELMPDRKVNFYTWKDVRDELCHDKHLFILAYRDTGRYPFDIYPSLLEGKLDVHGTVRTVFLNILFGNRYEHNLFYYSQVKARLLSNELRYRYFKWKEVEARIEGSRPVGQLDFPDEEDDDEIPDGLESIKVRYMDGSSGSYYPSRLMICQQQTAGRFTVLRMDQIQGDEGQMAIQPLDELYLDLNPFQVTPDNEIELQVIKEEHHVYDPKQALWKVLLVRRKDRLGTRILYAEIEQLLKEHAFVRYEYFKDYWLDVNSALLVPRKRRHFRRICDYLELPSAYYRLKLKKRASLVNSSRKSTARMNGLLQQMFKQGLFEPGVNILQVHLRQLVDAHDLEEVGIDEENVNSELAALVELLREKLHLKQVQKIDM